DTSFVQRDAVRGSGFQCCQMRWRKLSGGCQLFHGSVSAARRNQRHHIRATFKGKIDGTIRPFQSICLFHKWRFYEDEDAQIDVATAQPPRRRGEVLRGHTLVQALQNFGMHGFEPHCNFEPASQTVSKVKTSITYQCRMTLHNDLLKRRHPRSNFSKILRRNRARVEETSTVIELDLARRRQTLYGIV